MSKILSIRDYYEVKLTHKISAVRQEYANQIDRLEKMVSKLQKDLEMLEQDRKKLVSTLMTYEKEEKFSYFGRRDKY